MRIAALLALALLGCATGDEVLDLANGETKTDGDAYLEVTLSKADRVRFQIACNEIFSCDITIAAVPTHGVYDDLNRMLASAHASDFPRGLVAVKASGLGFSSSIDLGLAATRGDSRVDGGGPIGVTGDAQPVYYGFSTALPATGARDRVMVDLTLDQRLPFDDGEFRVYAFWH